MSLHLALADANGQHLQRDAIPDALDDGWIYGSQGVTWSPDGSAVALALYNTNVGATLMLRRTSADQATFVPFPDEQITYYAWSPTSRDISTLIATSLAVSRSRARYTYAIPPSPTRISIW